MAHPCLHGDFKSAGQWGGPEGRERGFYPKKCSPINPSSRIIRQGGGVCNEEARMGIVEAWGICSVQMCELGEHELLCSVERKEAPPFHDIRGRAYDRVKWLWDYNTFLGSRQFLFQMRYRNQAENVASYSSYIFRDWTGIAEIKLSSHPGSLLPPLGSSPCLWWFLVGSPRQTHRRQEGSVAGGWVPKSQFQDPRLWLNFSLILHLPQWRSTDWPG